MNIPKVKMLLATLVAGLWVVGGRAATNYVDCSLGDYTGHDGSSWAMAFETIQEGVDAANVGDVVLVAPGDYVKGGKRDSITNGGLSNRVLIARKAITLKSAGGRGAARIVGQFDMRDTSATFPGLGGNAVRCVCIVANSADETPVVEGFTIADGATDTLSDGSDRSSNIGGGVQVSTTGGANSRNAFIVDCNITNCIATRAGGGNGGAYVRCRVEDCTTSKNNSSALRWVKLYNCLIVRNGRLNSRTDSFAVGYVRDGAEPCDVVNCTFAGNSGKALGDYPGHVYNCLFSENYNVVLGTQEATYNRCLLESTLAAKPNCITPSTDLQLFAPAIGDYRLLPRSDAIDAGDVNALELIPEAYRDKDFDGNPRTTDGKVNIGCSQTVSPPPAGGAFVSIPRVIVNGFEGLGQHLHVFPTEYPTMYEIEVPREDYTNDTISLTGNGGVADANYVLYPRPGENRFGVVPPPLPSQYIRVYRADAKKTLWVQRDYAGGNGNPDGSSERPYTNIQDAVEAAGATATIIKVRPGVYDTGSSSIGGEGLSRVAVASTQTMRIESTDGPTVTTILGAEDPNGDKYGCGTDSVRCVYLAGRAAIQGFTLSGGRADNISGGVRWPSDMSYSAVSDCIITNCVAPNAAVARDARLIRCWIVDNYFSNASNHMYCTAIQGGYCMACVFSSNRCFDKTDVRYPIYGMGGSMFHCSGFGVGDYNITDSNIRQVDCVWDSFYRGSVGINAPLPGEGNFARNMPIGENANSQFTLIASPLARTPPFCRPYVTSPTTCL